MDNGYTELMVESDSMIIIGVINGSMAASCQVKHIIKRINELKMQGNFSFRHCFREVNVMADYLANLGEYTKHNFFFTQDLTLPLRVEIYTKNDIEGIPCFRIRAQRKNFTFDYG